MAEIKTTLELEFDCTPQGWQLKRCPKCKKLYWYQQVKDGQITMFELIGHTCAMSDLEPSENAVNNDLTLGAKKPKPIGRLSFKHSRITVYENWGQGWKIIKVPRAGKGLPVKPKARPIPQADTSPLDYRNLTGKWLSWYTIAYRVCRRVPYQEREDYAHEIMLELYRQEQKDSKPMPEARAYRIASFIVADYWRRANYPHVRCCILSGEARQANCKDCLTPHVNKKHCGYLAIRPLRPISLELPMRDTDGFEIELKDTVADDTAVDVPVWIDIKTWLLGCPLRLVEIAEKREHGYKLNHADRNYLYKQRKQLQKTLF